jgi:hypothetical protein
MIQACRSEAEPGLTALECQIAAKFCLIDDISRNLRKYPVNSGKMRQFDDKLR